MTTLRERMAAVLPPTASGIGEIVRRDIVDSVTAVARAELLGQSAYIAGLEASLKVVQRERDHWKENADRWTEHNEIRDRAYSEIQRERDEAMGMVAALKEALNQISDPDKLNGCSGGIVTLRVEETCYAVARHLVESTAPAARAHDAAIRAKAYRDAAKTVMALIETARWGNDESPEQAARDVASVLMAYAEEAERGAPGADSTKEQT